MPQVITGDPSVAAAASVKIAIVVSRFNESITSNLLQGAVDRLIELGIEDDQITVSWVPGAWEIPIVALRLASSGQFHAVIGLGAVIRGETTHDEYINHQVSRALSEIALETGLPVLFGVLTCQSLEQAIQRSGGQVGNKGRDCAEAALEMVHVLSQID